MNVLTGLMLNGWTPMRWLRLLAGIALLSAAWMKRDTLVFGFGALFVYQGLFNIRGCGMGACASGVCSVSPPVKDAETEAVKE